MPAWKAATFDCYGTLIDWEGGAAAFLYDVARRIGDDDPGPGYLLRQRWEEIQFEHIQQDYRSYNVVLEESLRAWVGERGYRWNVNVGYDFARSMQSWQPFPETIPALTRVREAGMPLAIVSNSENAIMDHTLRQLRPLEFDHVVLAEEVRCYKPDRRPFTRVLDKLSLPPRTCCTWPSASSTTSAWPRSWACRPPGSTATASRCRIPRRCPTTSGATSGVSPSWPSASRAPAWSTENSCSSRARCWLPA